MFLDRYLLTDISSDITIKLYPFRYVIGHIYSVMTLSVYTCVCGFDDDRVSILCLMQTNMVGVKRRTTSCDYSKGHKQGERDIVMTQREREQMQQSQCCRNSICYL